MNGYDNAAETLRGEDTDVSHPEAVIPAAYSILSSEALLAEVARAYPIPQPSECVLIRSFVNDVYTIVTPDEQYILKVYRARWRSRAEVAFEMDVLAHLEAKGVAVAGPIARRDGQVIGVLRAPEGVRYAVLFATAPGVKPTPPFTAELYARFGRATAEMHRALDDFASPHGRVVLDLGYLIDRPLAAVRPWLAHRPDDWAFLERHATKVRERIARLAAAGLDWGVCHGDLSLDNLHDSPDGTITFYDFDVGGPGWRASDFYGIFQYQPRDHWLPFIASYQEVRPLAPIDLAAVPLFVAATGIWDLGTDVTNWTAWSGRWRVTNAYFDRSLAQLRQWDAEHLGVS